MTAEQINTKIDLCEAAIDLTLAHQKFTIIELTEATGKSASEIYALFPNKNSILEYYYPSLVIRYTAMIQEIADFETYTIGEKISNFVFTLFDMMEERQEFVEDSFNSMIVKQGCDSEFHSEVSNLFKHFFTTDGRIAVSAGFVMKDYFYEFIAKEYVHIVKFWIKDDSEGKERTFALTDKLVGFVEEAVYNKVIDKGFDLAKYLISHAGLAKNIPLVGEWITSWFKEEDNENE
ncbi:MAG: hypothetical protein JXR20_12470 [Balneola sp.]